MRGCERDTTGGQEAGGGACREMEDPGSMSIRRPLTLLLALLMTLSLAAPAHANFMNGPDEAGVVSRFAEPLGAVAEDAETGLVAAIGVEFVGWDPGHPQGPCRIDDVGNVDQQAVLTPSGAANFIGQADIAVEVFDLDDGQLAICAGEADPIFTGDVRYRFSVALNPRSGFTVSVSAHGVVMDDDDAAYDLRVRQTQVVRNGELRVLNQSVRVTPRGR
jgi:hypothetical protein